MDVTRFNVFSEHTLIGARNRFRIFGIIFFTFIFAIISPIWVFCNSSGDIEELIKGSILVGLNQLLMKMIELYMHREIHRELIKTVIDTKSLQHSGDRDIGVKNFNRARFYILLTSENFSDG
jgi:hypothetical protein